MFETFDKMFLAGLGAISMTQERAEKIFDEFVSRGKAEKDSKAGFIKTLMDAADKNLVSHRGRALAAVTALVRTFLRGRQRLGALAEKCA